MNWQNVKLIWLREVRDQLRDRRTLFMIVVLPLLLYPLLGMSFLQITTFLEEHPTKVLIVGLPELPGLPKLVEDGHFSGALLDTKTRSRLFELERRPADSPEAAGDAEPIERRISHWIHDGNYDVVVYFPPNFRKEVERFHRDLLNRGQSGGKAANPPAVPSAQVFHNSAKEKSKLAYDRVSDVLHRWQEAIGQQNLKDSKVPEWAARTLNVDAMDVAESAAQQGAAWSRILPLALLLWALTGAFYPAIDLCAGEKERGTLETLLSSPAERTEIVTAKLLTVMVFSMATSLLNLASMGVTGLFVMHQMQIFVTSMPQGAPPWSTALPLVLALVPVSALFAALCLALASMARSSKEGQYYLMPLVLVAMPLIVLPMAPGVELTLGNSLIPLTGLVLLLRTMLEGDYLEALRYLIPVLLVTACCCLAAINWAVDRFNSESVLFSETERLDIRFWFKRLLRDKAETPTVALAVACGMLILVVKFFMSLSMSMPANFGEMARQITISQFAVVLTPAIFMTLLLTSKPAKTLLIRRPPWLALPAALMLAIAVHPLSMALGEVIQTLYPLTGEAAEQVEKAGALFHQAPNWWLPLVLIGLLPALCEELAFRGFILSGLRHSGHTWRAILLSSLFFAATHSIVQQSLNAFVLGTVIAYLAVRTGSIWPGLIFHATHNTLAWVYDFGKVSIEEWLNQYPRVGWLLLVVGTLAMIRLLAWFSSLQYVRTTEETLQEAIEQEASGAVYV